MRSPHPSLLAEGQARPGATSSLFTPLGGGLESVFACDALLRQAEVVCPVGRTVVGGTGKSFGLLYGRATWFKETGLCFPGILRMDYRKPRKVCPE